MSCTASFLCGRLSEATYAIDTTFLVFSAYLVVRIKNTTNIMLSSILSWIFLPRPRLYNFGIQDLINEGKKQSRLAIPLIIVNHIHLSPASMATSFAAATVLLRMVSALETLCVGQCHMLGVYTQRAAVVILAMSIAPAIVWYNTTSILGKDVQQRRESDQICGQNLASAGAIQLFG